MVGTQRAAADFEQAGKQTFGLGKAAPVLEQQRQVVVGDVQSRAFIFRNPFAEVDRLAEKLSCLVESSLFMTQGGQIGHGRNHRRMRRPRAAAESGNRIEKSGRGQGVSALGS